MLLLVLQDARKSQLSKSQKMNLVELLNNETQGYSLSIEFVFLCEMAEVHKNIG